MRAAGKEMWNMLQSVVIATETLRHPQPQEANTSLAFIAVLRRAQYRSWKLSLAKRLMMLSKRPMKQRRWGRVATKINDLSPPALSAAMRGGTESWGSWGSTDHHILYAERITGPGRRRNCHCGCKGRSTHRGMANGICLAMGCEFSIHRWVKRRRFRIA